MNRESLTVNAAPGHALRSVRLAALGLALSLLAGCSTLRLGYNQADWMVFRWFDGYADFDQAQAIRVRESIRAWFAWHRKTQLADYADLLLRIDAEVPADTSAERVCGWWSEVRVRIDRSVTEALPAIADSARALGPAQIEHIEQRYAKSEVEFRDEYMQADPGRRRREAVQRAVDRAESAYGNLDPAQKERIARQVAESPFDPAMSLAERRRRQQDALQTLRRLTADAGDLAAARAQIRSWVRRFERSPVEANRLYAERVVQHNCRLAADLHNGTTAPQRQNLSKKLRGWAADLKELASEAAD